MAKQRSVRTVWALCGLVGAMVCLGSIAAITAVADREVAATEIGPQPAATSAALGNNEKVENERVRAIQAQSTSMFGEYNARQAAAYAERFLPNAEYEQQQGVVLVGRPAIKAHFEKLFQSYPQGRVHAHESQIRTIGLHMAIEQGAVGIKHSPDGDELVAPFVTVWRFVDGRWSVASLRELATDQGNRTAHDQLQELAWMIGDWVDETDDSLVVSSCRWSADGNFLIQEFTVQLPNAPAVTGTQRIGYDPLTRKFRSWLFDSHGGFGEGHWNWDGERWVIRSTAVRHDGHIAASLNFIIPESKDSYFWQSSHRMSNGDNLPDLTVRVVRQASTAAAGSPEK